MRLLIAEIIVTTFETHDKLPSIITSDVTIDVMYISVFLTRDDLQVLETSLIVMNLQKTDNNMEYKCGARSGDSLYMESIRLTIAGRMTAVIPCGFALNTIISGAAEIAEEICGRFKFPCFPQIQHLSLAV